MPRVARAFAVYQRVSSSCCGRSGSLRPPPTHWLLRRGLCVRVAAAQRCAYGGRPSLRCRGSVGTRRCGGSTWRPRSERQPAYELRKQCAQTLDVAEVSDHLLHGGRRYWRCKLDRQRPVLHRRGRPRDRCRLAASPVRSAGGRCAIPSRIDRVLCPCTSGRPRHTVRDTAVQSASRRLHFCGTRSKA